MLQKIIQWIGTPASLILHSVFFVGIFALRFFGVKSEDIMLILTTIVSLEAIYLSILIQMSVNKQSKAISDVQTSIEEVHDTVEEVHETVEEVQDSVEVVQENVEEMVEDEQGALNTTKGEK